ncbi:hypothetical protein BJV82DRAFT_662454 [Fennellomyces sp. T-0311]|nr:hypothetical protein BJV82DRAFT_662454 [Fennellomyces sp. T-0311]
MFQRSLCYVQSFHKQAKGKDLQQSNATPIIFNLPYDILEIIWSPLTLSERLQCIQVCKTWRSQLLGSPFMWSELRGDFNRGLIGYNISGKDVRRVNLKHGPDGIDFLLHLQCSKIESITHAYIPNSSVLMKFDELLRSAGPALKSLHINTDTLFEAVLLLNSCELDEACHRFGPILREYNAIPSSRHTTFLSSAKKFPAWQSIQLGPVAAGEKPHTEFLEQGCKAFAYGFGWVSDTSLQDILRKHGSIMTAFHMTDTFGPEKCDIVRNYLIDIGASSKLRSLVITGHNNIANGFDLEEILDLLPWLEQLVLQHMSFSQARPRMPPLPFKQLNRSLKRVKFANCDGISIRAFDRLVHRFHPYMELVSFIELNRLPDLDSIADNVASLDTLLLKQRSLTNDTVLRLADQWEGKILNSLTIQLVGLAKVDRKLTEYVRQRLPNTEVADMF